MHALISEISDTRLTSGHGVLKVFTIVVLSGHEFMINEAWGMGYGSEPRKQAL